MKQVIMALALLLVGGNASAEELPDWIKRTTLKGLMFGDAYSVTANHDPAIEGENGFWFRRIYLTLESELSERWEMRLRMEMNSPGDFVSDDRIEPYIKDAYFKRKVGDNELILGLASSPTYELTETSWRYRFNDARRFVPPGGEVSDSGIRRLRKPPRGTNRTIYQVFDAYNGEKNRCGVQYARQTREMAPGLELDLDIASVYAVFQLKEHLNLLTRVDRMFDPNPDGDQVAYIPFDPTAESTLALVGLDFEIGDRIDLIPNVEVVSYDSVGTAPAPDHDLIARFTFFARF